MAREGRTFRSAPLDRAESATKPRAAILRSEGEYWTIGFIENPFRLRDSKGLTYLGHLLRHPGTDFPVLDLVGGATSSDSDGETVAIQRHTDQFDTIALRIGSSGDAGEMLDDRARAEYRRRLSELHEELDEAKQLHHDARRERAEQEIEALTAELSRAVGLGGRIRRAGSAAERARQSVTKTIKTVIDRAAEQDPEFASVLAKSIRTGMTCRYDPGLTFPLRWEFARSAAEPDEARDSGGEAKKSPPTQSVPFLRLSNATSFVGRELEAQALCELIDNAARGNGSIVMLGGGAGIGKTRLALHAGEYAVQKGFRLLIGRCYDREQPAPYLPVVEILEVALAQSSSKEVFFNHLGDAATDLVQIAPRLRRAFPYIAASSEPQDRHYLFQSFTEFLARYACADPLLVLFDDLHWADEYSLQLLSHLASRVTRIPLVIVGTYRDVESEVGTGLARTLEEMIRIGLRPLKLSGLPRDVVAQMLNQLAHADPPESLVNVIFEETQGNPFFIEETYRHLVEEGKVFDRDGGFRDQFSESEIEVPDNIRLLLTRRFERLDEAVLRVMGAAAIIGRSFSFRLLKALLEGFEMDDIIDAIESARRAGLIVASAQGPEAPFTFSHELVRQALLAELPAPRRQLLHQKTADAFEAVYPHAARERSAEIAYHLLQAGSFADSGKLLRYLTLAGEAALEAAAYEEARRNFEMVLSTGAISDSTQKAQLLTNLSVVERGLGHRAEAQAHWDQSLLHWNQALDEQVKLRNRAAATSILSEIVDGLMRAGRFQEAELVADRGLAELRRESTPDYARLLTTVGIIKTGIGVYTQACDAFEEAFALASRLKDPRLLARVLGYRAIHNCFFLRLRESIEDAQKSGQLIGVDRNAWAEAQRLCWLQFTHYHAGNTQAGDEIGAELEPLAKKVRHFAMLSVCLRSRAWAEFGKAPDLAMLEEKLDRALEIDRSANLEAWIAPGYAQLSLVRFLRGDWVAALEFARRACELELGGGVGAAVAGFGAGILFRHHAYSGEQAAAMRVLEENRGLLPRIAEPATVGSWAMLACVIEGLAMLGQWEAAAELYPLAHQLVATGAICIAWIARFSATVEGLAAAAACDWDDAERHFDIASRQAERLPHQLELAEVGRFQAAMLLRRGGTHQREQAAQLVRKAADVYRRMGMPRHVEISERLLAPAAS